MSRTCVNWIFEASAIFLMAGRDFVIFFSIFLNVIFCIIVSILYIDHIWIGMNGIVKLGLFCLMDALAMIAFLMYLSKYLLKNNKLYRDSQFVVGMTQVIIVSIRFFVLGDNLFYVKSYLDMLTSNPRPDLYQDFLLSFPDESLQNNYFLEKSSTLNNIFSTYIAFYIVLYSLMIIDEKNGNIFSAVLQERIVPTSVNVPNPGLIENIHEPRIQMSPVLKPRRKPHLQSTVYTQPYDESDSDSLQQNQNAMYPPQPVYIPEENNMKETNRDQDSHESSIEPHQIEQPKIEDSDDTIDFSSGDETQTTTIGISTLPKVIYHSRKVSEDDSDDLFH